MPNAPKLCNSFEPFTVSANPDQSRVWIAAGRNPRVLDIAFGASFLSKNVTLLCYHVRHA